MSDDEWAARVLTDKWLDLYHRCDQELPWRTVFRIGFSAAVDVVLQEVSGGPPTYAEQVAQRSALLAQPAFDALTPLQRRVVWCVCVAGFTLHEASEVFDLTNEGVRYHMKQAASAAGLGGTREMRQLFAAARGAFTEQSGSE